MGVPTVPGKNHRETAMDDTEPTPPAQARQLSPAAQRALAEAAARRAEIDGKAAASKAEKNGRGGLDPARYGDWEIKGLTADF